MTEKDQQFIQQKGITADEIEQQITRFKNGFPWLKLKSAATVDDGIVCLNPQQETQCLKQWKTYQNAGGTIEKFQPASGAASRMFKDLFRFLDSDKKQPETEFEKRFFDNITLFAFYPLLNKTCVTLYQKDVRELIEAERYIDVIKALLLPDGMNYGSMPKGLLKFHRIAAGITHTPIEEHLEEGAQYAADSHRHVRIHFTVSPEHRTEFERLINDRVPQMEKVWGVRYDISLSEQQSNTDTIAVDMDNSPVRDKDGNLLFRPAGHGALLENLNQRNADVVFIKNIDNVVPLKSRHISTRYKKIIGGYLILIQNQIRKYLLMLDNKTVQADELKKILNFTRETLCIDNEKVDQMDNEALTTWLQNKLNRPIRVCGVVRNQGEPGGGPYLAYCPDGSSSPQILESAQINPEDPTAMEMMKKGTHFNPVDLVCYMKDYKGVKFDLHQFVDNETGFISIKSKNGHDIKALELPGLWNGSMSDWNTIFVEVPSETFNPVKTVNDLLRKSHQ